MLYSPRFRGVFMLSTLLHILYVPVCVFLILVVLLQTGKRADLAGAFGGGGSQTAFGARGAATLLAKVTTGSAVLFMVIALTLSILSARNEGGGGTVLDEVPDPVETSAPADPTETGTVEQSLPESEAEPVSDADEPAQDPAQDAVAPEEESEQP